MSPQVVLCCGVGGTGKTTTAAALGVGYAIAGQRTVVLTIDPARRLADALDIATLGNTPTRVPLDGLQAAGSLDALMLDRKGTWDDIVRDNASPESADRLLKNRYYQAVSTRLTGSHEYMAVEKLHTLATSGRWDVVVLDTPPTQHVVDFFQAPDRIRGLLDRSVLTSLTDGGSGLRGVAARSALALLRRVAGAPVMGDIAEFFGLFAELSPGLRQRSAEVADLLAAPTTQTFLVAHADAPERNDLHGFLAELRARELHFAGFLINRVQPVPTAPVPSSDILREAGAHLDAWPAMADALLALPGEASRRAHAHRDAARELAAHAGGAPVWLVPDVPGGVRSVEGLAALAQSLPPEPASGLG